jgi:hypothetical protein
MIDMGASVVRFAQVRRASRGRSGGSAYCRISNVFSKKPGFAGRKGASFPIKTSAMIFSNEARAGR